MAKKLKYPQDPQLSGTQLLQITPEILLGSNMFAQQLNHKNPNKGAAKKGNQLVLGISVQFKSILNN